MKFQKYLAYSEECSSIENFTLSSLEMQYTLRIYVSCALVPIVPVPDVQVSDFLSVTWWSVTWGRMPSGKVNGVLRGYRLIYYLSYVSDVAIGGEIEKIVKEFDINTFHYKVKNLGSYQTYNVSVTAFTNAGNSPAPEYYASEF